MTFFSILKAQRRSGKPPSVKKHNWTDVESARAAEGICIACGNHPSPSTSYLCTRCEGEDSLEDIRSELQQIRNRILGR